MQWIDMHCDTLSELHRQNLQKKITRTGSGTGFRKPDSGMPRNDADAGKEQALCRYQQTGTGRVPRPVLCLLCQCAEYAGKRIRCRSCSAGSYPAGSFPVGPGLRSGSAHERILRGQRRMTGSVWRSEGQSLKERKKRKKRKKRKRRMKRSMREML